MRKRKTGNSANTIKKKLKLTDSQKPGQKALSPAPGLKAKEKSCPIYPQVSSSLSASLKDYKKRLSSKANKLQRNEKFFIVEGPAGSGKTHLVRQLVTDLKLKLLELNGSVNRSRANVVRVLGEATQTFSIEKGEKSGTVVFIDDVDVPLEPDAGFYKAIELILMNNKCPVVFACQVVPKFLRGLNGKIFRLDCRDLHGNRAVKRLMRSWRPGVGEVEIENVLNRTGRDLNAVASALRFEDLSFVDGLEVRVASEQSFEVLHPEGFFDGIWDEVHVKVASLELVNDFLASLQEVDLVESSLRKFPIEGQYRLTSFYQGIEKFYLKHRDPDEEVVIGAGEARTEYAKIAREHLAHMGETDDYAGYLQVLKEFPVLLDPSYLLRHAERKKATYFDIFIQQHPNLFKPS